MNAQEEQNNAAHTKEPRELIQAVMRGEYESLKPHLLSAIANDETREFVTKMPKLFDLYSEEEGWCLSYVHAFHLSAVTKHYWKLEKEDQTDVLLYLSIDEAGTIFNFGFEL